MHTGGTDEDCGLVCSKTNTEGLYDQEARVALEVGTQQGDYRHSCFPVAGVRAWAA